MLVVVTTISALVHLYSIGYMADDPHQPRFFCYLSLCHLRHADAGDATTSSRCFFGWEGVGLSELSAHRLLVSPSRKANAAAIKAFIVTGSATSAFHSASSPSS